MRTWYAICPPPAPPFLELFLHHRPLVLSVFHRHELRVLSGEPHRRACDCFRIELQAERRAQAVVCIVPSTLRELLVEARPFALLHALDNFDNVLVGMPHAKLGGARVVILPGVRKVLRRPVVTLRVASAQGSYAREGAVAKSSRRSGSGMAVSKRLEWSKHNEQ